MFYIEDNQLEHASNIKSKKVYNIDDDETDFEESEHEEESEDEETEEEIQWLKDYRYTPSAYIHAHMVLISFESFQGIKLQ